MYTSRSRSSRWQKFWLFSQVVATLLTITWCYDPCPEHLRRSSSAKPCNIPKSEIEKAFQEAEKNVYNTRKQEERLVKEGKVVNKKIKSPASTHQQAFVRRDVREMELRQRTFQEASAILTKKYKLPLAEVCCSLPKADLSSPSAARAVQSCVNPEPIQCNSSAIYRTADGTCNNLANPTWGSALSCFNRMLPAYYSDNDAFRTSVLGGPLPDPRTLSLNIHNHQNWPTNYVTHLYMMYGQFIDHDITLTAATTTADNEAIECCPVGEDNHPQCAPIVPPPDDSFYPQFNVFCLNFVRSAICSICLTGPRMQINQVTAFIDGSPVYGNSENETNGLRDTTTPGNLRVQPSAFGDLLPPSNDPSNDQCSIPDQNLTCFQTGDVRANQQPALTSLHTIWVREHNRIATRLRAMNPQWSEETIFQETRKIVGAEMQVIVCREYLPVTLGNDRMSYFDLWCDSRATSYESQTDPTLMTEFSSAAFRFGHSMINSWFAETPSTEGRSGYWLRNRFFWPFDIYNGQMDPLMRGSTRSPSQYFDRHVVPDVTNFLYRIRGNATGFDLPAFNIQRGRDHGLPSYVEAVRFCSKERIIVRNFSDLTRYQLMSDANAELLSSNYRDVRDVDMFPGILLEFYNQGAVVGPTAACIIGIGFYNLKFGDRMFYQHSGVFTDGQRKELVKCTLANVMCENSGIQEIQAKAMIYSSQYNPIQSCSSLPKVNLSAWQQ